MSSSCRDPPALALVKSIFSRSMRASSLLADQPSFIPPSSEYKKSQAALLSWPINLHFNRSPFRCCDCHLFPINRRASSSNHFKVLTSSHIASTAFTWGTIFVVPFYTLMILAPKAALAKRVMESNIPYVALGLMYGCLLHLSWTPATLHTIFATKYLLPELPGMTKMFSNEMTMASAWIHLLAVDLYAARQVYHDGLENNVETRHSVTFCLFFCPIGILSHVITKMLSKPSSISKEGPPPINEIGK